MEAENASERRILALDYGAKRVGVAITDPTGTIAQPLTTLHHGRREPPLVQQIAALVASHHAELVVLGLPIHMDGRRGPEAERVERLGTLVAERLGVVVEYVDERWTSIAAERALQEMGAQPTGRSAPPRSKVAKRRQAEKGRVDAVAATLLLRTYLARRAAEARC